MKTVQVQRRGCGLPKPGGFYAIGGGAALACWKLPVELSPCGCCGQCPAFARSPQRVTGLFLKQLFALCPACLDNAQCVSAERTYWLSFIGSDYTAAEFVNEVREQGMSRRIQPSFARLIKPGDVFANVKGNKIFSLVPVQTVRYYVKGTDTAKDVAALEADGIEVCKMEIIETVDA